MKSFWLNRKHYFVTNFLMIVSNRSCVLIQAVILVASIEWYLAACGRIIRGSSYRKMIGFMGNRKSSMGSFFLFLLFIQQYGGLTLIMTSCIFALCLGFQPLISCSHSINLYDGIPNWICMVLLAVLHPLWLTHGSLHWHDEHGPPQIKVLVLLIFQVHAPLPLVDLFISLFTFRGFWVSYICCNKFSCFLSLPGFYWVYNSSMYQNAN